jgi:hypothetical protein
MSWEKKWPDKPDNDVGYRKPPESGRFKKGQSGNPKGRRKRSKNGKTLLVQALDEAVLVTEGGVAQRMTKREAFYKTLVARALKEDRYAALLLKTMHEYDLIKGDEISREMVIRLVKADDKNKSPGPRETG